jgi:colicin import membrane protein
LLQLLRERPRPFIYAVAVHLALIAVLVFSLDWAPAIKPSTARKPAPVQAVVVDGAKLDAEVQRKKEIEAQKQREVEEKQRREEEARTAELKRKAEEKRAAELKREQELEAKRKAEAEKKALAEKKRKAEAERKRKEQEEARKKAEAEKKRQEEARKKAEAEKKRQEEARKKAEAEKKRKEEEARRKAAEAEMQARLAAEQERLAAQRQSAMQRMIDEYVLYIKEKVQRSWIRPPLSGAELSCTVEVRLIPSGEVIDAKIVRSSGNAPFDRSVETAVFKASPLPVPPDAEVMEQFRTLRFEFKPGAA